MQRAHVILGLAAFSLALGACGGDDDDGAASATTAAGASREEAAGGSSAYCDALVAFNGAVFGVELDETSTPEDVEAASELLGPLWADLAANAPDEVRAEVDELSPAFDDLAEGDAAAFNADESFETYTRLTSTSVDLCGFEGTEVTAVEYAFEGVPETVEAGVVAFTLRNEGAEDHEMIMFKKEAGDTRSAEEILADPALEEEGPGEFAGAAFAPAGGEGATFSELTPGDYVMVCFLPVGGAEDAPPHFTKGMVAEFSVT